MADATALLTSANRTAFLMLFLRIMASVLRSWLSYARRANRKRWRNASAGRYA
jgi:hypothetical protein